MKVIIGIYRLTNILSSQDILDLEAKAFKNKSHQNVLFKIQAVNDEDIYIQTTQRKNANNILDKSTLDSITIELFQSFLPSKTITVNSTPFSFPVVEVVTPEWVNRHLHKYNIKIKHLSKETGIDVSNFSAWINGIRPMSQIVKAMIFNVMKIYSLKEFTTWLNEDDAYVRIFRIKKYFDTDLIKSILFNNKNIEKYEMSFKEVENDFIITLSPKK
ncbi:MAG: hypothetical protein V4592_26735 [Bacteroidota bacterium]